MEGKVKTENEMEIIILQMENSKVDGGEVQPAD